MGALFVASGMLFQAVDGLLPRAIPLTQEASDFCRNHFGGCVCRYGMYPVPPDDKRKRPTDATVAKLVELATDRVSKADHSRVISKLKKTEDEYARNIVSALRLDRIGDVASIETYAVNGVKYAKGVIIKTTLGRTIHFYGSKREWVTPYKIDGMGDINPNSMIAEHVQQSVHEACQHLLPAARSAWRGKHKLVA